MIAIFIALALVLGAGGTVAVSDNARPGDALFGIDRAVENARLSLSAEEKKNELRIRFAEERLEEVKEIEAEQETEDGDSEEDDAKNDESKEEIKIGLEAALNLITDVNQAGEAEDPRLAALAQELSAYMNTLPEDARVEISDDKFRIKFDQGPEKIEIKEQGDNKTKIDVRTEEGRFKIEVRDGQIEIKTKGEDKDDDSDDDSKDELEVEAKIFSDKTVIEVEINGEKTTFSSSVTTEAEIVAAIVARFPTLTSAEVSSVLEIENEDEDDGDEEDDEEDVEDEADEKDEDKEDEDEDESEEEDEDRSGSNKDNN